MRLLLDTHIALWALVDDSRLPQRATELITDPANTIAVSAASVWEIALKHALGRGGPNAMPLSGREAMTYFAQAGYDLLPISPEHAAAVETLPSLHADPFDRMLVAQALAEPMRLLTHDAVLARYGDMVLKV
ncbi:MAG TPA: type II toxin-antitoxin system VapC family toxin [Caulobacteraceae bacterium]|nr:type II toxin-antitoxin system VapC family toxin [Caulobacteraceae bacterium]